MPPISLAIQSCLAPPKTSNSLLTGGFQSSQLFKVSLPSVRSPGRDQTTPLWKYRHTQGRRPLHSALLEDELLSMDLGGPGISAPNHRKHVPNFSKSDEAYLTLFNDFHWSYLIYGLKELGHTLDIVFLTTVPHSLSQTNRCTTTSPPPTSTPPWLTVSQRRPLSSFPTTKWRKISSMWDPELLCRVHKPVPYLRDSKDRTKEIKYFYSPFNQAKYSNVDV